MSELNYAKSVTIGSVVQVRCAYQQGTQVFHRWIMARIISATQSTLTVETMGGTFPGGAFTRQLQRDSCGESWR